MGKNKQRRQARRAKPKSQKKAERKARRQKIVKGVKKAVNKVAKAVGGVAVGAPLLPFVPMINAAIKKEGQEPEKNIIDKAKQFSRLVLKKGSLEPERENVIEDITSIISGIVKFFQGKRDRLKEKEAAGEELTAGEENTVDAVDAIEKGAKDAVEDEVESEVGEKVVSFIKKPVNMILLGLLLFRGIYYVSKKS